MAFVEESTLLSPRSTILIIQERDGSLLKEPRKQRHSQATESRRVERNESYRAEIPAALLDEQSSLIERIIAFAFDTLGAQRVDLRVRESE
jgi:hypothetical protein